MRLIQLRVIVYNFREVTGRDEPYDSEVIDRGTNFDYLPPERKAQLAVFFSWFPFAA